MSSQKPDFSEAAKLGKRLAESLSEVLYGSEKAVKAAVLAVLSGHHLLIEDAPGVGKTILAKALAKLLGATVSRIQGQPDLLPSDILGFSMYMEETKRFEFRKGPIFANVVLCDELNRTPPRTQAALLEAMEEKQVSLDGMIHPLPDPHLVIATQNPITQTGTFPLVESQVDRFGLSTSIGYPPEEDEIRLVISKGTEEVVETLSALCSPQEWKRAQEVTRRVRVSETVAKYAVALCRASRNLPGVVLGISPRGAISLVQSARAAALLSEREYVVPEDVREVAPLALSHRLVVEGPSTEEYVKELIERTPPPLED